MKEVKQSKMIVSGNLPAAYDKCKQTCLLAASANLWCQHGGCAEKSFDKNGNKKNVISKNVLVI